MIRNDSANDWFMDCIALTTVQSDRLLTRVFFFGRRMLSSDKGEQRSFGNGRLRDQWEKRAQNIADQCKQEGQLREKSSLKL